MWLTIGCCFSAILFLCYYFLPSPFLTCLEYFYPQVIFRHTTHEKVVALTIDDGPKGESTSAILDLLKKYNAKATWFIIGSHCIRFDPYNHLLNRMIKEGHQLGNHTYMDRLTLKLSYWQIRGELQSVKRTIDSVCGDHDQLFRPGGGLFNTKVVKAALDEKHKVIIGNNYPHDGERLLRMITPSWWYAWYILKKLNPGDIIILHDLPTSLPTLQVILPELQRRGYRIVTVTQLLDT